MICNIILDLDETLIHSTLRRIKDPDFKIIFPATQSHRATTYYVKKRPGLDKFLRYIFKNFKTVSVWTAATRDYAEQVIANIFTKKQRAQLKYFHSREHTQEGIKPLKLIFNDNNAKNLKIQPNNTIIIDDKKEVVYHNPGNGIIIPAWLGKKPDNYLSKLIIVLSGIIKYRCITDSSEVYLELVDISG